MSGSAAQAGIVDASCTSKPAQNSPTLHMPAIPAALGLANIAGSACCCYNATGSFSRSAVNNDVGAKTQLASGEQCARQVLI